MIELASRVWKLSAPATIAKLRSCGLLQLSIDPDDLADYERQLSYRQHIATTWREAREVLPSQNMTAVRIADKHLLSLRPYEDRWREGPGQIFGVLDIVKAARLFYLTMAQGLATEAVFPRPSREGWDYVLTFPLWDLPERPCAFMFVGRQGRPEKDIVVRQLAIANSSASSLLVNACGLSFHPLLHEASLRWQKRVLVMGDPLLAAMLQTRHAAAGGRMLPIASWPAASKFRPHTAWGMLTGRRLVFWLAKSNWSIPVLHQAIRNNGLIVTGGAASELPSAQASYWKSRPIQERFPEYLESARPWQEFLAEYCDAKEDHEVEELLRRLELDGLDVAAVSRQLPRPLQSRVGSIVAPDILAKECEVDGKTVYERDGGWYIDGKRAGTYSPVMNAILRLDAIIHLKRLSQTFYKGRLVYKGEEIEFCVPMKEFEDGPFTYLTNLLLRHKSARLTYSKPWAGRLTAIAQQFQEPRAAPGIDRVGWDSERAAFVLPHYRIEFGGEVAENEEWPYGDDMPGLALQRPESLSGQDMDLLLPEDGHTRAVVAAALTAITANILAPAFAEDTHGLAVYGPGAAETTRDVARLCGCATIDVPRDRDFRQGEKLRAAEQEHGWPKVIRTAYQATPTITHWLDPAHDAHVRHSCVLPCDWYQANARLMLGGWHVIRCSKPTQRLTPPVRAAIQRFLPAYLLDLCRRNLRLFGPEQPTWLEQVRDDMADFVRRHRGAVMSWPPLEAMEIAPASQAAAADAFADLIVRMSRETDDYRDKLLEIEGEGTSVPKQLLENMLRVRGILLGEFEHITELLITQKRLVRDEGEYWVVETEWLQHRRDIQKAMASRLKVIS